MPDFQVKLRALLKEELFTVERKFTFTDTNLVDALYIENPSTNTKNMYVFGIHASLQLGALTAQENQVLMQAKYNFTASLKGTSLTIKNKIISSSKTTLIKVYREPTITASGTMLNRGIGLNEPGILEDLLLKPGDDLLIRLAVNDAENDILINMDFAEI